MLKITLLYIFMTCLIGQTFNLDQKTFSNAWAMMLSAGQYSTAKISDEYQIELGYMYHPYVTSNTVTTLVFDNNKLPKFQLNSIYAFVDLPIHVQLGFRYGLPIDMTVFGHSVNLYGFSAKVQFNQWLSDKLPDMSIQIQKDFTTIGSNIEVNVFSPNLHISQDLWIFTINSGVTYYTSQFVDKSVEIDIEYKDLLIKAGLLIDLKYIKIFAERSFSDLDENITYGASIVF